MMAVDRITSVSPDDEILGDWNAPEGSEPWCKALRLSLQTQIKSIATVPDKIRWYVEKAVANRAWVHWLGPDGKPFRDFDAFCAARPPYGLGRPFSEIRPYIEAVKGPVATAAMTAGVAPEAKPPPPHVGPGRGKKNAVSGNEQRLPPRGATTDYLSARIARDAPEVHAKMVAGEYPSVRAAAMAAGIVKAEDPVKTAARAMRKVPVERRHEVLSVDVRGIQSAVRRLTREEQEQIYEWLGKELHNA